MPLPPGNTWRIFCAMRASACSAKGTIVKRPVPAAYSASICATGAGICTGTRGWKSLRLPGSPCLIFPKRHLLRPFDLHGNPASRRIRTVRPLLHPEKTIFLHLSPHSLWMPGDGDMLHLLEILRLRQTRVELALEKERHESFSQKETLLLSPLVNDTVTGCVLPASPSPCRTTLCAAGPCMKRPKVACCSQDALRVISARAGRFSRRTFRRIGEVAPWNG